MLDGHRPGPARRRHLTGDPDAIEQHARAELHRAGDQGGLVVEFHRAAGLTDRDCPALDIHRHEVLEGRPRVRRGRPTRQDGGAGQVVERPEDLAHPAHILHPRLLVVPQHLEDAGVVDGGAGGKGEIAASGVAAGVLQHEVRVGLDVQPAIK